METSPAIAKNPQAQDAVASPHLPPSTPLPTPLSAFTNLASAFPSLFKQNLQLLFPKRDLDWNPSNPSLGQPHRSPRLPDGFILNSEIGAREKELPNRKRESGKIGCEREDGTVEYTGSLVLKDKPKEKMLSWLKLLMRIKIQCTGSTSLSSEVY
ncbi:hypothetical protein COLO4_22611 [Corchorus olitorius]|uniref:Uncharacterized protein n=1 Tax=Corchorus olitorius TaxID=93759 RepID=A0A1R3IL50_9ROSI|nr:hypothetical protein COLO4_22611 [Corchorus olitorius]